MTTSPRVIEHALGVARHGKCAMLMRYRHGISRDTKHAVASYEVEFRAWIFYTSAPWKLDECTEVHINAPNFRKEHSRRPAKIGCKASHEMSNRRSWLKQAAKQAAARKAPSFGQEQWCPIGIAHRPRKELRIEPVLGDVQAVENQ